MNKTFCGRLQANVLADRYTFERQLAEGGIDLKSISGLDSERLEYRTILIARLDKIYRCTSGLRDFLRKRLELSVEHLSALPLLLLELNLVLIAITVFSFPISSLIKLHV